MRRSPRSVCPKFVIIDKIRLRLIQFRNMRRVVGSILITSLSLFFLSLPMLHLHPGTQHSCIAVIHSHMPHAAGVHHRVNAEGRTIEDNDDGELEEISVEISAVCPTVMAPVAPPVDLLGLLPMGISIHQVLHSALAVSPDPVAQPPPFLGSLAYLRSPPA
jgi:hypothetical protein